MTLEQRLSALATLIGGDVKTLLANQGNLATLTTTAKGTLVAAINELAGLITSGGAVIDDGATYGDDITYSVDKILELIQALKDDLLGGVPAAAFDTLKEIADYIGTDQTATSGLVTAVGLRVRVDAAQSLNDTQKAQARANIGALSTVETGDPDTDLVTIYNTAKA